MKLSELAALPLTYAEVGATAGPLPAGYHHVQKSAVIGRGRRRFEDAAEAGMRWGMLRGAGLKVEATTRSPRSVRKSSCTSVPVRAPCRVVYVVDEPDRRGFAYGTLPGHAESGEELFLVRYDPATDEVYADVTAFSRHATWWSKLGSPVTSVIQRIVTDRYLRAL